MQITESVEITGHLMDTGVLARILDDVLEYGGDYVIERLDVGRTHTDESHARICVSSDEQEVLQRLLMRLQTHGVNQVDPGEAVIREADADGVFPEDFYSTTNLETRVRVASAWLAVERPEMDCGLLVREDGTITTIPVSDVMSGDRIICGASGVKVVLPARASAADRGDSFEFMSSDISSEKPQALLVRQIAEQLRTVKAAGL